MIELADLDYFRPQTRTLRYFSDRDGELMLGIEFQSLYIFEKPDLAQEDNILLPSGTSVYCPSLRTACYGQFHVSDLDSQFMLKQLGANDMPLIKGIARCHDWVEMQIEKSCIPNAMLDQLIRVELGALVIGGFQFGIANHDAQVLPIDGFHIEFVGRAS
jgi:hypothetical protein